MVGFGRGVPIPAKPILIGDIGGTNARFALLGETGIGPIDRLRTGDYPTPEAAIGRFLAAHGGSAAIGGMALAVAGPVEAGRCALTNSHWVLDTEALRRASGLSSVRLVNDFEATAWSLPRLKPEDLVPVGGGPPDRNAPALAMGPGTGLGVACYLPGSGRATVLPSEGGHATMAASDAREAAVIAELWKQFGHVSAERLLSGDGLGHLYGALARLDQAQVPARTPEEITQAALDQNCPQSHAALTMFCAMLGSVAGNLALTFRAAGGIYIAGGIMPRLTRFLTGTRFRERFEQKGRPRPWLERVPIFVIIQPDAAMIGLQTLLGARLTLAPRP
ncbi:glucokinase [Hypericibacter sp.]|uniref:glucokinase n=1 Tax=Hypericibacter sp. TaxID=2705401 RepID=UPI003D6D6639